VLALKRRGTTMLGTRPLAKKFYERMLGLKKADEDGDDFVVFKSGDL
jgi:hypothetical protein